MSSTAAQYDTTIVIGYSRPEEPDKYVRVFADAPEHRVDEIRRISEFDVRESVYTRAQHEAITQAWRGISLASGETVGASYDAEDDIIVILGTTLGVRDKVEKALDGARYRFVLTEGGRGQ